MGESTFSASTQVTSMKATNELLHSHAPTSRERREIRRGTGRWGGENCMEGEGRGASVVEIAHEKI